VVEQEETLQKLQDLYENLMRDAYDIGLDKDSPRSSQRNRFAFNFLRHELV
jgi:protein AFG1